MPPFPCDAELVGAGEDAAALAGAALTAEGVGGVGAEVGALETLRAVGLAEDAVPEVGPALVDGSAAGTLSGACGIGEGLVAPVSPAGALDAAETP